MNDDDRLAQLVRAAIPRTDVSLPSRDLWPCLVRRSRAPARVSWRDVGLAALVAAALLMRPGWLWLLAYHL
jgi:hypothetical protein